MCGRMVVSNIAAAITEQEDSMMLIQVKIIEGVFTAPQKQEIVECLTESLIEIGGGGLRPAVWCIVEEVAGGRWGVGGQTLTSDDVKALARG